MDAKIEKTVIESLTNEIERLKEDLKRERLRNGKALSHLKAMLNFVTEWAPKEIFNEKNDYYSKGDEECPFFSERFLYPLLGKDDARSVLYRVEALQRLLSDGEMLEKIAKAFDQYEKMNEAFFYYAYNASKDPKELRSFEKKNLPRQLGDLKRMSQDIQRLEIA